MERKFRTEEVLDMVWIDDGGGEIRKGILAYALFTDSERQSPPFPVEAWPAGTRFHSSRLTDEDDKSYAAVYWTILPGSWPAPESWCAAIESTLKTLSDGDAVVAWCGIGAGIGTSAHTLRSGSNARGHLRGDDPWPVRMYRATREVV